MAMAGPRAIGWAAACVAACVLASAAAAAPAVDALPESPAAPGPDRPAAGRSLFATLLGGSANGTPAWPLSALLQDIERRAGVVAGPTFVRTLIPLGRSLQREAAAPEYFRHPRIAAAAVAGHFPADLSGEPLRDRLYIAGQEKAAALEVISWNRAAGRFEFERVADYRADGARKLEPAPRGLCLACHQNAGPLFARPLWNETSANPAVAAALARERLQFDGIPAAGSIAEVSDFAAAVARGNLLATWQRLWGPGCAALSESDSAACRASALLHAARTALGDGRAPEPAATPALSSLLARAIGARWPDGLAVPDGSIADRIPLASAEQARDAAHIAAAIRLSAEEDPAQPRPPADRLRANGRDFSGPYAIGLASSFGSVGVAALDRALAAAQAGRGRDRTSCKVRRQTQLIAFECGGEGSLVALSGWFGSASAGTRAGVLTRIAANDAGTLIGIELEARADLDVAGSGPFVLSPRREGRRVHRHDGDALEALVLEVTDDATSRGVVGVTWRREGRLLQDAVERLRARGGLREGGPFDGGAMVDAIVRSLPPP